jgi:hypothetical protein
MKSSSHSLISFLQLFYSCQFRRLDSIQFLCYQAHILAGWRFETQHDSTRPSWTFHGQRRKCNLSIVGKTYLQLCSFTTGVTQFFLRFLCRGNVFTQSSSSNEHLFWLHHSRLSGVVTLYFIARTLIPLYKRQRALLITLSILLRRISNLAAIILWFVSWFWVMAPWKCRSLCRRVGDLYSIHLKGKGVIKFPLPIFTSFSVWFVNRTSRNNGKNLRNASMRAYICKVPSPSNKIYVTLRSSCNKYMHIFLNRWKYLKHSGCRKFFLNFLKNQLKTELK